MKKNYPGICIFTIILFSAAICSASAVPRDIVLTPGEDFIAIDWHGDTDADSFIVYWGTTSSTSDDQVTIPHRTGSSYSYTRMGLESNTTYWISISSENNGIESNRSAPQSTTTTAGDIAAPAVPAGLGVNSLDSITETRVPLEWQPNTESDFSHYTLYTRTASDSADPVAIGQGETSYSVTGLAASNRYFFSVSATDDQGNESEKSAELIVDTLNDTSPPFPPVAVSPAISGTQTVTAMVRDGNRNMADFSGIIIYYGPSADSLDLAVDIGAARSYDFTDLPLGSTWYFAATAYDNHQNESTMTAATPIKIEKTASFLGDSEEFEGGCFINGLFEVMSSPSRKRSR